MSARLIAVSGPLHGRVYRIGAEELTIGRLESSNICVPDLAISRRHAVIRREGDRIRLEDLGSRNGCYVNNVPTANQELVDGDRIGIGESLFVIRISDEDPGQPSSAAVEIEESEDLEGNTIWLRHEDAVYLQPDRQRSDGQATPREVRDLQALLSASQAVSCGAEPAKLVSRLLDLIMNVVPAERGAILYGSIDGEFDTALGLDRRSGRNTPVPVSRTVLQLVLSERRSLLRNDIARDELLRDSQSIASSRATAVLAAPIPGRNGPIGVVYLAMLNPIRSFEEADLQLVTAIAGIAAPAFESARRIETLEQDNRLMQSGRDNEQRMIGNSAPIEQVYNFIKRAARENSTVLIHGESGTGKELVANALHANSLRAAKPFVAVNCAALVDTLLESELFGHEKGAYTGADSAVPGKVEAAHGGTLFLDEIAELNPRLQAKLLRAIDQREVERVGATKPRKVDVRIIAATNRNLEEEIRQRNFREDLYFRLKVLSIRTPTLRERREDIIPLANYFVARHCRLTNRRLKEISNEARCRLVSYDWPGNVRELANAVERAVVMGSWDTILPEDLPEGLADRAAPGNSSGAYEEAVRAAKKEVIVKTLTRTEWNYAEAAKLLGIHVNYLHRSIRLLGIKPPNRSPSAASDTGA
jgi:two-component system, NtrC family, response regulator HydG